MDTKRALTLFLWLVSHNCMPLSSTVCTLKHQGQILTNRKCVPRDPSIPMELSFKAPPGLDSTKSLEQVQRDATAQIQNVVDSLSGLHCP